MNDLRDSPIIDDRKGITASEKAADQRTGSQKVNVQPNVGKATNITPIVIEKIIIHILGPSNDQLTLSDFSLNRKKNPATFSMVENHILTFLESPKKRKAKFVDLYDPAHPDGLIHPNDPDHLAQLCNEVILHPRKLVSTSKTLAEQLNTLLVENRAISECDLVCCLFHLKTEPQEKYLAILKLGLNFGLINVVGSNRKKKVVRFGGKNPFAFDELQKGAIIGEYDEDAPYDLLLIDHQTIPAYKNKIAIFFKNDFLSCKLISDDFYLTQLLYNNLIDIENLQVENGKYRDARKIHDLQTYICSQTTYDLDRWMIEKGFSKRLRTTVNKKISNELSRAKFSVHQEIVRKYCGRFRFTDNQGLVVWISGDQLSKYKIQMPRNKNAPIKITLMTNEWKRIK